MATEKMKNTLKKTREPLSETNKKPIIDNKKHQI